jgi:hypothetical protein
MKTFQRLIAVTALSTLVISGAAVASQAAVKAPAGRAHATTVALKVKKLAFKGSYTGTISLLWSSTGVTATSVVGHGTGTLLGSSSLSGKGAGTAASTCNPFSGTGYLAGAGSKLLLKVVSSTKTQACAANSAAPTPVSVKGVATVTGGTGKYKGATGTLSFSGSFSIQSTTAGSSESDSFSATISGTLTIKS